MTRWSRLSDPSATSTSSLSPSASTARHLLRVLFAGLCLCAEAGAQDYDRLIQEAVRIEGERSPGEPEDAPLVRAYSKLAEAAQLDPRRHEAFLFRGTNRCRIVVACRRILAEKLNELRIGGATPEELKTTQERGREYIEARLSEARHDFQVMERNLQLSGHDDPDVVRFASAAVKYARGLYEAKAGERGAIDDWKELVRRQWGVRPCSEFIARCYTHVGAARTVAGDYIGAQEAWDEGLKWAQTDATRQALLTNKAGAYEMDGAFGEAKRILKLQIEEEPNEPAHWKNLGLVLGYENRLRHALHCYGKARELCGQTILRVLHGNAWLKSAMIHGKLLEEDGDLLLAWRLFLEYRDIFGDDYNFCINFGDFAFQMGQYDLAAPFLVRARDLQPLCTIPHQLLLLVASRGGGDRDEVLKRIEEAREGLRLAQERAGSEAESPSIHRICAGLRDQPDVMSGEPAKLIEPDPLAGFDADRAPDWIVDVAGARKAFRPYDPEIDDREPEERPEAAAPGEKKPPPALLLALGLLLVGVAVCVALFVTRRGAAGTR